MKSPPRLPLEQQLCFTLYRAGMAINRTYKPLLDEMGITYPQYLVLSVLEEADGSTIGGIAARLALEPSTVTPTVKRMEAMGLVQRRRDTADERQVQVWLTEQGRSVLGRCGCLGAALLERSGLSPERYEALNEQMQALNAALTAGLRGGR
ncbi:MarR family winged helix-turn-helix transcriptional regulator [Siccirubricoccus sp. KC 17139]|uniref:MarR family winged helix-turn-helix transcriptional regulator n=1 Tax=Siccirubricoccus soli TaxID=2899147 RepID=A0ABT1DC00_9PROT|nr:MarR family winged helix-turn-helix transcriptional regulator [Siccirubricoccus soli]MCO6418694.1 MarR family winged helix-turn-helix transcriptional regulator [Siccirubricoccus soli]MCP2684829.1 MarR family winged helix-turn-helix transcriptional regulator [Siccirubricoccus soli]